MAGRPKAGVVRRHSGLALSAIAILVCLPLAGQTKLTLEQATARSGEKSGFAPARLGESVVVRGTVNSSPFRFTDYSLLAIEDGQYGALLQLSRADHRAEGYVPGDELEVTGKVAGLDGIVVIQPDNIRRTLRKTAPVPADVPVEDLVGFRYLGRLVRTRCKIADAGYANTGAGGYLVADASASYKIFVPNAAAGKIDLKTFKGVSVEVTGIAFQFCKRPPFNGNFQLLVNDPAAIARQVPNWPPPVALAVALGVVALFSFFWWSRERRLRTQRETLRKTYKLGEEILGSASAETILKRIRESLPEVLGVTRVHLFVHNRASKSLEAVAEDNEPVVSISLAAPPGGTQAGAVACFHYRTLLVVPDIDRSPFPMSGKPGETAPRSLLFVPMLAQGEVIGVLELDQDDRVRDFSTGEQELAQHLGNQIGVALRLLDQRSVQEQLFRTEKLAAVGRLISGVVNELQTPLSSIRDLANRALERYQAGGGEREVSAIAAEAQKAANMVARLVSFASAEQVAVRPVSISALLRTLIEFREGDWKALGIRVQERISPEPMCVMGSHGQLEQVFLNLFVHAEQSMEGSPQKNLSIRTDVLMGKLVVDIGFSAAPGARNPEETASVLGVTRSVIAGHGGEVRLIEKNNAEPRFEVEIPTTTKERSIVAPAAAPSGHVRELSRSMTALVIEPDEAAQRQVRDLLAGHGFRVVPVDNADSGLDLAHRMRFDVALCSVRAPGLNWVELSERMHSRVDFFILLSEGYDPELASDFEGDGRFVLAKPVQEPELDRVIAALEAPGTIQIVKNGAA